MLCSFNCSAKTPVEGPAPDVFAQVLNYYNGDYKNTAFSLNTLSQPATTNAKDLFNGMVTSVLGYTAYDQTGSSTHQSIMATNYKYDVLYRLKTTQSATSTKADFTAVATLTFSDKFAEKLTYDANGNISTLQRYKADGTNLRDKLTYYYKNNQGGASTPLSLGEGSGVRCINNQLLNVTDEGDINAGYKPATSSVAEPVEAAYAYDLQGRLIKDASKQISSITWTAFNKVETITRATGSTKPNLTFKYDAFGHRIYKKVDYSTIPLSGGAGVGSSYEEWYILDASGTEITSYKKLSTETNAVPQQIHIFAASKVGYYKVPANLTVPVVPELVEGERLFFEITDYQGSVRAVVTGTKDANGNAQIVSLTDYYAFGFL